MNAKAANPLKNNQDIGAGESGKVGSLVENTRVSPDLKAEKLAYILEMLLELRKLSDTVNERMVAYLIEMAILETNTAINVQEFGSELGGRTRKGMETL